MKRILSLNLSLFLLPVISSFTIPTRHIRTTHSPLFSSKTLSPSPSTTVGVLGSGYVSILAAKLAALRGYDTWIVHPPGEEETILSLYGENKLSNLLLIPATSTDALQSQLRKTSGLIIAVDSPNTVMDTDVIRFVLNSDSSPEMKRVSIMSRNLNGKGMGFFVKSSKLTANSEVWSAEPTTVALFQKYEEDVKKACDDVGAAWTICRAGTLKGGACGEDAFPQFLSSKYYEMTKKDLVTWQLLFDCKIRGVDLKKGDVMEGPGVKAVFTATSSDQCNGDTSRCGICEAMVRSLEIEACEGADFSVGTKESREVPTEEEWAEMWKVMS